MASPIKPSVELRWCLSGWLVGVATASWFTGVLPGAGLLFLGGILCLSAGIFLRPKLTGVAMLAIACFLFGVWRLEAARPKLSTDTVAGHWGQEMEFKALVASEPNISNNRQRLKLKPTELSGGYVLASVNLYPEFSRGDTARVTCRLLPPRPLNDFAYDWYLYKEGVFAVCDRPQVVLLATDKSWFKSLTNLRLGLKERFELGLTEPQAGLGKAMVLNYQGDLDRKVYDEFGLTGVSHVISISGLHLTLIAAIILQLLIIIGLNRRLAVWPAAMLIAGYVLLVGWPAAAARSAVMSATALAAVYLGRLNRAVNAWLLAGCLLTAVNPWLMRGDIGFQLSFLAIGSLLFISPKIYSWLLSRWRHQPDDEQTLKGKAISWLCWSLAATVAASLATWPIIVNQFGRLSLLSPLSNLLVVPVAEAGLIASMIGLPFSFLSPEIFLLPAQILFSLTIKINHFLAGWPLAGVSMAGLENWQTGLYYIALALAAVLNIKKITAVTRVINKFFLNFKAKGG